MCYKFAKLVLSNVPYLLQIYRAGLCPVLRGFFEGNTCVATQCSAAITIANTIKIASSGSPLMPASEASQRIRALPTRIRITRAWAESRFFINDHRERGPGERRESGSGASSSCGNASIPHAPSGHREWQQAQPPFPSGNSKKELSSSDIG